MQMCPNCSFNNYDPAQTCVQCKATLAGLLGHNTLLEGRYQVIQVLGSGGFGAVYLAEDTRIAGRKVAVKENLDTSPQAQAQFRAEVSLMVNLNHPGLPKVSDQFIGHLNRQYMVMDYIAGDTLEDILKGRGPLPEAEVVTFAKQLLIILEYLHTRNPPIVHRDVKPANIKLTPDGTLVLVDFGIAKFHATGRITQSWAKGAGTPGFAPLEQYGSSTDSRSDLYSLGAVIYYLLTGQEPPEATELAAGSAQLIPPRKIRPDLSLELQRIVFRAMAMNALDRYQSAAEMRLALSGVGGPPRPPRSPLPQLTLPPFGPRTWRVIQEVIFFVIIIFLPAIILILLGGAILYLLSKLILTPPIAETIITIGWKILQATTWVIANWVWFLALVIVAILVSYYRRAITAAVTRSFIYGYSNQPSKVDQLPPPLPVPSPKTLPSLPLSHPTSVRLKYESWLNRVGDLKELQIREEEKQIKDALAHIKGRRLILTGYGSFGATSLLERAVNKVGQELKEKGEKEGVFLVFHFKVTESSDETFEFDIEANQFSIGTLTSQKKLEPLKPYASSTQIASSGPYLMQFSLRKPLKKSFLKQSGGLRSWFLKQSDFGFTDLVNGLKHFALESKDTNYSQGIVLQLIGSQVLPSRVAIILDRIGRLETLEVLAQSKLFENEHITVIAVARREDFDVWENCNERLRRTQFEKWYLPCLGHTDIQRIVKELLDASGIQDPEAERNFASLVKHLELVGKGILGDVIGELRQPRYYSYSDQHSCWFLNLNSLPDLDIIEHNAWLQRVLDKNWKIILSNLFIGQEEKDRARVGVYHVLNHISKNARFTRQNLVKTAQDMPIKISNDLKSVNEIVDNIIYILTSHHYLELTGTNQYKRQWNKETCLHPTEMDPPPRPQPNRKTREKLASTLKKKQETLFTRVAELEQKWQIADEETEEPPNFAPVNEQGNQEQQLGVSPALQDTLIERIKQISSAAELKMMLDKYETAIELTVKYSHRLNEYRKQLPITPDPVATKMQIEQLEIEVQKAYKEAQETRNDLERSIEELAQKNIVIKPEVDQILLQ